MMKTALNHSTKTLCISNPLPLASQVTITIRTKRCYQMVEDTSSRVAVLSNRGENPENHVFELNVILIIKTNKSMFKKSRILLFLFNPLIYSL